MMQIDGPFAGSGESPRSVIVVLGVHPVGMSVTARLLHVLGADVPSGLVDQYPFSPETPCDERLFTKFNDSLLASAGTRSNDWREVNAGWIRSAKATEFRDEALKLFESQLGSARLCVLSNPRIARILPLWTSIFKLTGVHQYAVTIIDNPLALGAVFAESEGFTSEYCYLLWLRNMLDAEVNTRGQSRVYISFDLMLRSWSRVAQQIVEVLGLKWPRGIEQITENLSLLIPEDVRNHTQKFKAEDLVEDPLQSVWLRECFRIFERWTREGESSADYATLDSIRAEFGSTSLAFGSLISHGQKLQQQLKDKEDFSRSLASSVKDKQTEVFELEADLARLSKEISDGRQKRDRLTGELRLIAAEKNTMYKRISDLEQECSTLIAETAELKHLQSLSEASRESLLNELEMSQARLYDLTAELHTSEKRGNDASADLAKFQSLLNESENNLDIERSRLAEAEIERLRLAAQLSSKETSFRDKQIQSTIRMKLSDAVAEARAVELANLTLILRDVELEKARVEREKCNLLSDTNISEVRISDLQADKSAMEAELKARINDLQADKSAMEAELKARINDLQADKSAMEAELKARISDLQADKSAAEAELKARMKIEEEQVDLIKKLTAMIELKSSQMIVAGRIFKALQDNPGRWSTSRGRLLRQRVKVVQSTGLFDAAGYLKQQTDVADAGIDPLQHYIQYGMFEGRAPNYEEEVPE
jgi:hypothetical protein